MANRRVTPDTEGIKAPLQNAARPIDTYYTPAEKPVQKPDNTNPMLELAKSLAASENTFSRAYAMMQEKKTEDKSMQQHLGEGYGRLLGSKPVDANDPTYKSLSTFGQFHAQVGRAATMTDEFLNALDSDKDWHFIVNQTEPSAALSGLKTVQSMLFRKMDEVGIPKDAQAYSAQNTMAQIQQKYEASRALAGSNRQAQGAAQMQGSIMRNADSYLKTVNQDGTKVVFSTARMQDWKNSMNGDINGAIMAGVPMETARSKAIESIIAFASTLNSAEIEDFVRPGMFDGVSINGVPLGSDPDLVKKLVETRNHIVDSENARATHDANDQVRLNKGRIDAFVIQANNLLRDDPNADLGGIIDQMSTIPGASSEIISLQKYQQQVRSGVLASKHRDDDATYTSLANMLNNANTAEDRRKLGDAATAAFSAGLISKESWMYFTSQAGRSTDTKTAYDSALIKESLRASAQMVKANTESFMKPSGDAAAVARYHKIMADYRVSNPNATAEEILKHSELAVKTLSGGSGKPKFKSYNTPTTSKPKAQPKPATPKADAPMSPKDKADVEKIRNEAAAFYIYNQVKTGKLKIKDLTPHQRAQVQWQLKQNQKNKGK